MTDACFKYDASVFHSETPIWDNHRVSLCQLKTLYLWQQHQISSVHLLGSTTALRYADFSQNQVFVQQKELLWLYSLRNDDSVPGPNRVKTFTWSVVLHAKDVCRWDRENFTFWVRDAVFANFDVYHYDVWVSWGQVHFDIEKEIVVTSDHVNWRKWKIVLRFHDQVLWLKSQEMYLVGGLQQQPRLLVLISQESFATVVNEEGLPQLWLKSHDLVKNRVEYELFTLPVR